MVSQPNGNVPAAELSSGAALILRALVAADITHLFVNLGSDHPAFLTAFATRQFADKIKIFTAPNEMNALSAASGFAQVTGRPAAVLVHVECGTLGLAGAIHNVSKGRIPVMILAGTVPITMEGELPGSRNEYIHWIQDVPDQRAIIRQYMRYEHEIRRPHNAVQLVLRAVQFIMSEPRGPAYLVASREALEEKVEAPAATLASCEASLNGALEPSGLMPSAASDLAQFLLASKRPLIVTSYSGRSPAAFAALHRLAELVAIAVHDNAPIYNNFPTTSTLHQGHQWNGGGQLPALAEADVVLVVDADVPWIGAQSKPKAGATIYHLDCDPLKETTTLWSLPATKRWKVDSAVALDQIAEAIESSADFSLPETKTRIEERRTYLGERFAAREAKLRSAEAMPAPGRPLTVPFVMARLREAAAGIEIVGLNESTTNLGNVADHLCHNTPLSLIGSGGGALGWYSGAAVGAALGLREDAARAASTKKGPLIVAFTGDGTWLFGVPSCAYWMAAKYDTPFVTIIWNNGGWASPKNACLRIHPEVARPPATDGAKSVPSLSDKLMVALTPSPAFGKIAEGAAGAWWATVREASEVDAALQKAIAVVREEKRCALIEVVIPTI
ncbi:hypothetical protein SEUCBS139899_005549 [Sporothrix eucalyptigena]|uniref:Pyruvate decarboxylase n=1 Tax=Sporothrix eucalyptigena TaxID=1812306 RepID=A0ABP0C0M8_9PEZI